MGLAEEVAGVILELQSGRDRSLFGSLTTIRTRLIKSDKARALLLSQDAGRLLLSLLGDKARHGRQTKLPDLVMSILANLCLDNVASEQILTCGGLETIATFTLASEQESIQNRGVRALANLAHHNGVVDELFNLEVPEFVAIRLLETEDEECRVTYCRAIRQIGKTSSGVKQLVDGTVAVQALATMLKLDDKNLALKGLRTLADFSALRCCAQFAGQILSAKVEEELVAFSEDEDKDIAIFSLSLIHRLCEQGMVRPSLGAAGVVTLLVRLMSSTRSLVNRVSVLNSLCLCSMDSVNRNRILDAGALEIFLLVLNGEESSQALAGQAEAKSASPNGDEDKFRVLRGSKFHVLYERIIGCLVNFIYHDLCMNRLVRLGIIDILLLHLQRCSNYQISPNDDITSEIDQLANAITSENQKEVSQKEPGMEKECGCVEADKAEISKSSSETDVVELCVMKSEPPGGSNSSEDGKGQTGGSDSPGDSTGRTRHESKGFKLTSDPEWRSSIQAAAVLFVEAKGNDELREAAMAEDDDEEEQISQNIRSRDPLNIDNQGSRDQSEMAASTMTDSANGESSRKVRHTFSINSPTYQSEISRRSEEGHRPGMTCKDYSQERSHLLTQGASPGSRSSPFWAASPANNQTNLLYSPQGFQSPYSPLSANASYYSPTLSSPPYSGAPFSPPSSLPPQSPASQPGLSPASSWINSSLASPGQRSMSSVASPLDVPTYRSPQSGSLPGSFSPLNTLNIPGSPSLQARGSADIQSPEIVSPLPGAGLSSLNSPGLFSDTNSQDGVRSLSFQGQIFPRLGLESEILTQGTITSTSPMYSATDDDDDDDDGKEKIGDKDRDHRASQEGYRNSGSGNILRTGRHVIVGKTESLETESLETACEAVLKGEELSLDKSQTLKKDDNGCSQEMALTFSSVQNDDASRSFKCSNKRPSTSACDIVDLQDGNTSKNCDQSPKRSKLDFSLAVRPSSPVVAISSTTLPSPKLVTFLSTTSPSTRLLDNSSTAIIETEGPVAGPSFTSPSFDSCHEDSKHKQDTDISTDDQTPQSQPRSMEKVTCRGMKKLVPRSSKVSKKFQRMLSAPCPETTNQSQKGFKKRASLTPAGTGDGAVPGEGSSESPCVVSWTTSPSSPLTVQASSSTEQGLMSTTERFDFSPAPAASAHPSDSAKQISMVNSSPGHAINTKFSTLTHRDSRETATNPKLDRYLRKSETNILILLSCCSVRQDGLQKMAKANILTSLLSYVRNAPAPLLRSCRILKRVFSNPIVFSRLIRTQMTTHVIRMLILEDDGSFPAAMFCTEWEDMFGQVRRSRMNLSDLLPSSLCTDDSRASASQTSDFGRKLDFEFGGDAYKMAMSSCAPSTPRQRLYQTLYSDLHNSPSNSQSACPDVVYPPWESRTEGRVRAGLKLLGSLSTVATSSFGAGEIQHLSQRGKLKEQLSCRILMLHVPVVWGRMMRHQFALKHQASWESLLSYLFMEKTPVVVRMTILIGLSFNMHLDFPPKLVARPTSIKPCPDTSQFKTSDLTSTKVGNLSSHSGTSVSKSHPSGSMGLNLTSGKPEAAAANESSKSVGTAARSEFGSSDNQKSKSTKTVQNCEVNSLQSPRLFDEDEEEEEAVTSSPQNDPHQAKCPYWKSASSHDVTFIIIEDSVTYRYGADRCTMVRRSEVFAAMLGGAYAERLKPEIELSDTKASSFECVVHYLHGCTCQSCSVLACLALDVSLIENLSRRVPPSQPRASNLDRPSFSSSERADREDRLDNLSRDTPQTLDCVDCEDSLDSLSLEEPGKDASVVPASCPITSSGSKRAEDLNKNNTTCDSDVNAEPGNSTACTGAEKPKCDNDSTPRASDEAFSMVRELINVCSDVLVLADCYLLTDLVNYLCSVLSHMCLHTHTWADLFKLASMLKLRPLAVDCMREALMAHESPRETAAEFLDLATEGFKDQAIEALSLLLKSARIH